MIVVLWLPTMSMAFKLFTCIDLPRSTLQVYKKMTESLSCHQKKYFNDFPSGMSYPLSKGQGQIAQFVNKPLNQSTGSQENCCKQIVLFLFSCGSSCYLKWYWRLSPRTCHLWTQGTQFCPVPLSCFCFYKSKQSPAQHPFWLWKVLLDTIRISDSAAEKRKPPQKEVPSGTKDFPKVSCLFLFTKCGSRVFESRMKAGYLKTYYYMSYKHVL